MCVPAITTSGEPTWVAGADSAREALQLPPIGRSASCTVQLSSLACAQTTTTSPRGSTATAGTFASAAAPEWSRAVSHLGGTVAAAPAAAATKSATQAAISALVHQEIARRRALLLGNERAKDSLSLGLGVAT